MAKETSWHLHSTDEAGELIRRTPQREGSVSDHRPAQLKHKEVTMNTEDPVSTKMERIALNVSRLPDVYNESSHKAEDTWRSTTLKCSESMV